MNTIIKPNDYNPIINSNTVIKAYQSSVYGYKEKYLKVNNYLSEFENDADKEEARKNLDIYSKFETDSKIKDLRDDLGEIQDSPNQSGNAFERINYLLDELDKLVGTGDSSIANQIKDAINALKGDVSIEYDTLKKLEDIIKQDIVDLQSHKLNVLNPHNVTKEQVGLGNVENIAPSDMPVSTATQQAIDSAKSEVNTSLEQHKNDKLNPHEVTKEQVGLDRVDNTNDLEKPISIATQQALDIEKQERQNKDAEHSAKLNSIGLNIITNILDVTENQTEGININYKQKTRNIINDNFENETDESIILPLATQQKHGILSKEDKVKIDRLETTYIPLTQKGAANGVATLDSQGQIPSNQLPSYVDDVIDCYATFDKDPDGLLINIKLYSDSEHTTLIVGEVSKIYTDIDSAHQFRWTGTQWGIVGAPTVIGTATGTAFDGKRGKDLEDRTNTHIANTSNPHNVTKQQVGLGNVDNTSDIDKPVSTAQQAAIDEVKNNTEQELNRVEQLLNNHTSDSSNPHNVTKIQIGLSEVDNTSDLDKPISIATQTAITELDTKVTNNIESHKQDLQNPHQVTKAQIGLGNVDNTSDLNKPISIIQQEALDLKLDKSIYNTDKPTFATKTELQEYVTKTDANEQYQPVGNYATKEELTEKQNVLVSGTNIKTINGQDLLGTGNLTQEQIINIDNTLSNTSENPVQNKIIKEALDGKQPIGDYALKSELPDVDALLSKQEASKIYAPKVLVEGKQDKLVSGQNIKTINGETLLGSGDLTVMGGITIIDSTLSPDSTNPVQNKIINSEFNKVIYFEDIAGDVLPQPDVIVADTSTKALQDWNGNNIIDTYATKIDLNSKQNTLVSGTSIKTINNQELLGQGNLTFKEGIDPDEEDISNVNDKLKFTDRLYDISNFSGKGYKILRKNITDGKNVLTQNMINEPDTIYEIRYDFDLNGKNLNLPQNSTLKFNGGLLNNGTLIGNNTRIIADENEQIFKFDRNSYYIGGTWRINKWYCAWFGTVADGKAYKAKYNDLGELEKTSESGYFEVLIEGTDNFEPIQEALDAAYNTNVRVAELGVGAYRIVSPLNIGWGGYHSIYFKGVKQGHFGDITESNNQSTIILCDTGTYGICINSGYRARLSDFDILGWNGINYRKQFTMWQNTTYYVENPEDWNSERVNKLPSHGLEPMSPYAGIVTDAFLRYDEAVNPYELPKPPTNIAKLNAQNSTGFTLERVTSSGFCVGFGLEVGAYGDNADFYKFYNCKFNNNVYGLSTGSNQARNTALHECAMEQCYTAITNMTVGTRNGGLFGYISNCWFDACYKILEWKGDINPVTFYNCYCENAYMIGGNGSITSYYPNNIKFIDCNFRFNSGLDNPLGIPSYYFIGAGEFIRTYISCINEGILIPMAIARGFIDRCDIRGNISNKKYQSIDTLLMLYNNRLNTATQVYYPNGNNRLNELTVTVGTSATSMIQRSSNAAINRGWRIDSMSYDENTRLLTANIQYIGTTIAYQGGIAVGDILFRNYTNVIFVILKIIPSEDKLTATYICTPINGIRKDGNSYPIKDDVTTYTGELSIQSTRYKAFDKPLIVKNVEGNVITLKTWDNNLKAGITLSKVHDYEHSFQYECGLVESVDSSSKTITLKYSNNIDDTFKVINGYMVAEEDANFWEGTWVQDFINAQNS